MQEPGGKLRTCAMRMPYGRRPGLCLCAVAACAVLSLQPALAHTGQSALTHAALAHMGHRVCIVA